jgi:sugar transferase (PEP-CTERM/EpsH1 system associated)
MIELSPPGSRLTLDPPPVAFRRSGANRSLSVLYLCHRVPYPPDKGDKIRTYHQLRTLSARHRIHLLALEDGSSAELDGLSELCAEVEVFPLRRAAGYLRAAAAMAGRRPLTLAFFDSRALARRVVELTRKQRFDVVVACSSSTAPYALLAQGVPRVLDMVDVDSAKWEQYARFAPLPLRPVYTIEARRLAAYEAAVGQRFARVVLATGREAADFRALAPGVPAEAIGNGIDLDVFRPLDLPKAPHPTLIFTGQMDYFANVDGIVHFAEAVLPRLKERFLDLELLIVGRSPAARVRALADLPGVHVTGAVGDVRPFLARAWVFVAPLRIARGVQNKVLEAMASNLPVVCSGRVLAGLSEGGFEDGRDLLARADDEGIERAVATLLADAALRERMAAAARDRLAGAYQWSANLRRFEELLLAAAGGVGEQEPPRETAELPDLALAALAENTADGEARSA